MRRLLSALACFVLVCPALPTNAAPGDVLFTRPGQLVRSDDGLRLNLYCSGHGSPVVVFDSGHQDWSPAWAVVQPQIAKFTRACSYDRRGSGFSDPGPLPRTSVRIADELHSALQNAGVKGPYILVGHAFGGINVRTFAYRFMPEVAGLVLVDTDSGDVEPPEALEREHKFFTVQAAELRACRDAIVAGRPLNDVPPPTLVKLPCEQRFFRGFPEKGWSPALNATALQMAKTSRILYAEVVSELEEMPGDEVWLKQHQQSLGSRPIRVLTAANPYNDDESTPTDVHLRHLKNQYDRGAWQARFLELSSNTKQLFAYHSGSAYIQLDQPQLVIGAIREAYEAGGNLR